LLYYDGLLYLPDGLAWFQVLQVRHNALTIGHFGFNKTMELVSRLLVAIALEVCEGVCQILQGLWLNKKSFSSPSWSPSTIVDLCIPMVSISMDFITDLSFFKFL
jgi:hypothetical protein